MNIKRLEAQLGPWVLRHRWMVIIFSVVLTLAAAFGGQYLTFDNDSRVFFSKDNPQLQAFDAMERTYSKSDNVMFVITDPSGDLFNNKTLSAIEWLTEESWKTPHSSRVDSITNFQYTYADGDEMIVEDLVMGAMELEPAEIALVKQRALKEPLLVNRLIAPAAAVSAVNITIQKPDEITQAVSEVAAYTRDIARQFRATYPELELHQGGGLMFNHAFMEASMDDMSNLVPFMYAALVLVMFWLLRSFTGTLSTFLIIGFSVAVAMGLAGWFGMSLTPPSANSPTIILTIAIAHCIHILSTFSIHMRRGESKYEAITESLRINLEPVVLTSITTAIGFLSMNAADAPPFHTLGNIVAIGSIASMFFSLLTLPALIAVLPVRTPKQEAGKYHEFMESFGDFVVRKTKVLTYGTIAVVALTISGMASITLDDNFTLYFDEDYKIRQYADYTMDNLTGLDLIEYSLNAGGSGDINDPAYLKKIEEFANWYRQQPHVAHVSVLTDIIKRLNKNMHNDDENFYKIPEDRELAAQYLLLYEMSLPYGLDLNNQINVDKSATRMIVVLKRATAVEIRHSDEVARRWLADNAPPEMATYGASISMMFAHISQRNIESMLVGTIVALLLISFILLFALRSFKIGVISLVPNLFPAAMAFGAWGYLVGEVGMVASIVGSMSLGIIVDDTVHFLSKYIRARREKGLSAEDGVRYAFTSVGKALMTTTIILVAGFAILTFSGFKLNSETGALTAIAVLMALVTDFLLLPGILLKFDQKKWCRDEARELEPETYELEPETES